MFAFRTSLTYQRDSVTAGVLQNVNVSLRYLELATEIAECFQHRDSKFSSEPTSDDGRKPVLRLSAFCLGQTRWASTRRNIHPLLPIVIINHPLSASSIYYKPWHPSCSIYMPNSLFAQFLSKFYLLYLLAWHPTLHTPYISSPNHCLLFAAHAHTITICFAVVLRLCHLILISLSTLYLWLYLTA